MIEQATPCVADGHTLEIVNVICNCFQMIVLSFLGHRVNKNGYKPAPRARNTRTRLTDH